MLVKTKENYYIAELRIPRAVDYYNVQLYKSASIRLPQRSVGPYVP